LLGVAGCGSGGGASGGGEYRAAGRTREDAGGRGESGPSGSPSDSQGLLMRAQASGRDISLFEKVVVTSGQATIAPDPGELGDVIEPWAIFFRLWTDDGHALAEVDGEMYVRVGNSKGKPLGWIRERDTTTWSTRFILEPLRPIPGRVFSVDLGDNTFAEYKTAVEDKRRFALITASPTDERGDETRYPVVVYTGLVQPEGAGGTIRRERNQIRDLKLEVVFVVEASHLMAAEYEEIDEAVSALHTVQEIAKGWVGEISKDAELKDAIRFGVVEFQDATSEYQFVSRVSCPLTGDLSNVIATLDDVPTEEPDRPEDWWMQDTLAGMQKAVESAGWSENSSKHIIVFGCTKPQTYAQGEGPNPFGRADNEIKEFFDRDNSQIFSQGYNTTGLTIQQLIARANPRTGGDVERSRNAKTFHAVLVGYDLRKEFEKAGSDLDFDSEIKPIVERVTSADDQELGQMYQGFSSALGEDEAREFIVVCFIVKLWERIWPEARQVYSEIGRNQEVDGMNVVVEPNAAGIRSAINRINATVVKAFHTLSGVRTGRVGVAELENDSNAITQTYFAIVGAAAEKFKDKPCVKGYAKVRDDAGREVAHKRVIVAEDELRRLRSTLDAIRTKFQARVRKADRQDVSEILDELKSITAQTATGQDEFSPDVELKDVITDLPLRTTALETTPRSLAVMPSDAFKDWLQRLDVAIRRADDLLAGKNWLVLSSLAANEKFTFLRLNELP